MLICVITNIFSFSLSRFVIFFSFHFYRSEHAYTFSRYELIRAFIHVACSLSARQTSCRLKIFPDFAERSGRMLQSRCETADRRRRVAGEWELLLRKRAERSRANFPISSRSSSHDAHIYVPVNDLLGAWLARMFKKIAPSTSSFVLFAI